MQEAENLIFTASNCETAVTLYEACGEKATSYKNLYILSRHALKKCEKEFLPLLTRHNKRDYNVMDRRCYKKDASTPIFYSPKLMCQPYIAHGMARIANTARAEAKKMPNPPL
ncbi:MAG: hypothetical protein V4691_01630 [Pseudomonadota bacterium]